MTFFTIIGVLVFWSICWNVGYVLAMACDAKARIDDFCKPVHDELEVLISALTAFDIKEPK